MQSAVNSKLANQTYYGSISDETTSVYFDDWYSPEGLNKVVSISDRVPPGKYAIVRDTIPNWSGITSADTLSNIGYYARTSYNLRGLIFSLGDDRSYSPEETGHVFPYMPSNAADAFGWQRLQYLLGNDSSWVEEPTGSDFYGNKSLRDQYMVLGAYFKLGENSFNNPIETSGNIAFLVNKFGFDFVVLDVADNWNREDGADVLTYIIHCAEMLFLRPKISENRKRVSAHRPIFIATTNRIDDMRKAMEDDDDDGIPDIFEPLFNGFTSGMVFPAPKIPANGTSTNISHAFAWGKPLYERQETLAAPQCYIDLNNGFTTSNVSYIVNSMTDKEGGYSQYFSSINKTMGMNSGLVILDSLHSLINAGVSASQLGRTPTRYWDFRVQSPLRYIPIMGNIVPSWSPEPVQDAVVDYSYANAELGGLILELENWKTGGRVGSNLDKNLPDRFLMRNVNCPPARRAIYSWLKFDDLWLAYTDTEDKYIHAISGSLIKFNGTPIAGDEGLYPLLIEVYGVQNRTIPEDVEYDPNKTQLMLNLIVKPGPSNSSPYFEGYPPLPYGTGSSHITSDFNKNRIPYRWNTAQDWCSQHIVAKEELVSYRGNDLSPDVPISCDGVTNMFFKPEHIDTIVDWTQGFGWLGMPTMDVSLFGNPSSLADFIGFVFATIYKISQFNPSAELNIGYGLFGIPAFSGYYTEENLKRPPYNISASLNTLREAWRDANGINGSNLTCSPALTYKEKVRHAFTYFVDAIGNYPTAHGGVSANGANYWHNLGGCSYFKSLTGGTSNDTVVNLMNSFMPIHDLADCIRGKRLSNELPGASNPTSPGGTVRPERPDSTTISGCPVQTGLFYLGRDCDGHSNNDINNYSPPALDLVPRLPGLSNYVVSPCHGYILIRYTDPRSKWATIYPNHLVNDPTKYSCDGKPPGLGNAIELLCDNGDFYVFGHLSDSMFLPYTDFPEIYHDSPVAVNAGVPIGIVGSTGCSTGDHIHMEIYRGGPSPTGAAMYGLYTYGLNEFLTVNPNDSSDRLYNYSRAYQMRAEYAALQGYSTTGTAICPQLVANCP